MGRDVGSLMATIARSLGCAVVLLQLGGVNLGHADERAAYLVRVPVPIVGSIDTRIIRTLDRILTQISKEAAGSERAILVLEFWPPEDAVSGNASSFERSLALARYLASPKLEAVRTVAYVPRSVFGHAVLPIIACEQLIVHPDAEIGDAGAHEATMSPTLLNAYREIASRRQTIPVAVALGMLDKRLVVSKVTTDAGVRYELEPDVAALREQGQVQAIDTLIQEGDAGRFTGRTLRLDLGFASHLATDRRELASALQVQSTLLEPDPSLGDEWRPIRIDLDGIISDKKVDRVLRILEDQTRTETTNFICLQLDSPGGFPTASLRLAAFLADLDSARIRTVCYVKRQALADAAWIATACDHTVLVRGAVLGGIGEHEPQPAEMATIRETVQDVARRKGRSWSVPLALGDPTLEIRRYTLEDSAVTEHWTEEEWKSQTRPERWQAGEIVHAAGAPWQVSSEEAESIGLAHLVVDGLDEFRTAYQLEGPLPQIRTGWADELIEFLASPQIAFTLLFFAGFALIAELGSPGVGVAGFVSLVCFVLFFWSQFLHGTATWLEVLLFLMGLLCIGVELFLLPGFGVFGFGGGALVIASLVLASQTFIFPRNEYQLQQLPRSLLIVMAAGGGIVVGLALLRRFIDEAPFLRHVVLNPPQGSDLAALQERETISNLSDLRGQQGLTVTTLMPSGKARFGKRLVDVVTEGEPIDRGVAVEVVDVQAHRVVVRAAAVPGS